jgi:hypothetical protein
MKNILYFSVLFFSSINICSAGIIDINGHIDSNGVVVNEYEIVVDDAAAFSVDMTSINLIEASVWLFDDICDLVLDDQLWIDGVTSIYPGDLITGIGDYTLAVSIFGVMPFPSNNLNDGWDTSIANPDDKVDYKVTVEGASLAAAPALPPAAKPIPTLSEWGMILMSALLGLTVFARQRKLI